VSIAIQQLSATPRDVVVPAPTTLLSLEFRGKTVGQTALTFPSGARGLFNAAEVEVPVTFVSDVGVRVESDTLAVPKQLGIGTRTVDFGTIDAGAAACRQIRLFNLGFAALTIVDVDFTGTGFASFFGEPFAIPAYGFVGLPVCFQPVAAGSFSGELIVTSDDDQSGIAAVELTGIGVDAR
jgi:hypothetical protein